MLRNVRVQFFKKLIPVVPDIYRKYNSSDLISKMVDRVEALQNIYLRVYYPDNTLLDRYFVMLLHDLPFLKLNHLNYISDKYLAPLESIF